MRTYLELDDPARLRPAGPPRLAEVEIARVVPADGELSRWFYVEVGTPHRWTDNLARSDAEWQAWAERVETWVATVAGERAGYYELLPGSDGVEVAYFGLLPAFQGQGLGGHLLTHALAPCARARAARMAAHEHPGRRGRAAELSRARAAPVPARGAHASMKRCSLGPAQERHHGAHEGVPGRHGGERVDVVVGLVAVDEHEAAARDA